MNTDKIYWPAAVREHMKDKSIVYHPDEKVYEYGFYDGFQFQQEKIADLLEVLQKVCKGDDAGEYTLPPHIYNKAKSAIKKATT